MAAPSLAASFANRERVFSAQLPRGLESDDLGTALSERFSHTEILGVQCRGSGRHEVLVASEQVVTKILEAPLFCVKGKDVKLHFMGSRMKEVIIMYFPLDVSREFVRNSLGGYGTVHHVTEVMHKKFKWRTGHLRVTMDMTRPVPNFLRIAQWTVQAEYAGMRRFCRRCGLEGHIAVNCKTERCVRCGVFGHGECSAACPRCGADHAVNQCRRRTFASVAGFTCAPVPELPAEEETTHPEPAADVGSAPVPVPVDAKEACPPSAPEPTERQEKTQQDAEGVSSQGDNQRGKRPGPFSGRVERPGIRGNRGGAARSRPNHRGRGRGFPG